ncbi:hypothetical protein LCGC14_0884810 [marine sediment metagenome]|uniref:Uncharacterized protein n=1 Tax=marine sediment metagenome TaxID=412755 RepID=A0A0F9P5U7_9ZZZZ
MNYEVGIRLDRIETKLDFIIEKTGLLREEPKVKQKKESEVVIEDVRPK